MSRNDRKPSALKHGAFSRTEVLPWEDSAEYEELRRGLIDELQPNGRLQDDCVNSIAYWQWRKHRVLAKRNLDIAEELGRVENLELWEDPPPLFETSIEGTKHALSKRPSGPSPVKDDYQQLLGFSTSLYRQARQSLVEMSIKMLPPEFSAYLQEKVPANKFGSTNEWIIALKKEVDGNLLPMVRGRTPREDIYFKKSAAFLTGDRMLADLELEKRIDTHIDGLLKRLWQLKTAREIYRPPEPKTITNKAPKQIRKVERQEERLDNSATIEGSSAN